MKAHRPTIMGTRYMIVACQYLAAEAGFQILNAGGNAIDAGVAAGIALAGVNVVTPRYKSEARVLIETRENIFLRPDAEKGAERGGKKKEEKK